jgi:hypothetical protein
MPAAHPIFGRDVPDAIWRPGPHLLADAQLAGFLRSNGEHDLERLQARAVADPGWFWGPRSTTSVSRSSAGRTRS